MPNRIIKESICTSENLDRLAAEEERFFFRLMVCCDDYGVMDARPAILRAKCFPLKESIDREQVEQWLCKLAAEGLVLLYQAEGKPFLRLVTWDEHQRIRSKRHKYPMPETCGGEADDCSELQQPAADCGNLQQLAADCGGLPPESESNPDIQSKSNPKVESKSKSKGAGGRIAYGENVFLSLEEYAAVSAKIGEAGARRAIEMLDNYKGASGKTYASDYRAILSWVLRRVEEERAKGSQGYCQRAYDAAHFERDREDSDKILEGYYESG